MADKVTEKTTEKAFKPSFPGEQAPGPRAGIKQCPACQHWIGSAVKKCPNPKCGHEMAPATPRSRPTYEPTKEDLQSEVALLRFVLAAGGFDLARQALDKIEVDPAIAYVLAVGNIEEAKSQLRQQAEAEAKKAPLRLAK